jgi:serine/threonine-protein kinase
VEAGRVLGGRYRVLEQIGGGGSAVVWRGYDQVLNRLVAIKVLSGPSATGRQAHDRIHAEARMAAALSHPHIAQIHDVGDDALDTPYVVMELVDGPTVDQVGPLTIPQVLRLGAEVASALSAAHAIGLVHRDIKPANIIVTAGGAKVVDFGIAAPARVGGPAEPGSQLLGTPAYVAPERLTRDGVEPASDVYSLGVLLYRLLAGHLPWTAESTEQMLTDQVYVEPAPLPARPGLPPAVVDLCTACLAKNPADRPPATLVARALAAAAQSAIPTPDVPVKRSRTRLLLAATAAVAAVAALVAWQVASTGPATVAEGEATPPSAQAPGPAATAGPDGSPAGSTAPTSRRPIAPDPANPSATASVPVVVPGLPGSPPPVAPTPGGPIPVTHAPPPPAPPQPSTFTSEAGTVTAVCTPTDLAELRSWQSIRPYTLGPVRPGPADAATADFLRGRDTVRMTVTCADGRPSHTVTRIKDTPPPPPGADGHRPRG